MKQTRKLHGLSLGAALLKTVGELKDVHKTVGRRQ
jgi:hypothetical protein